MRLVMRRQNTIKRGVERVLRVSTGMSPPPGHETVRTDENGAIGVHTIGG